MDQKRADVPLDLPRTDPEFEARFRTEEMCIEYLRKRRWPEGFICPKCQGRRSWQLRTRHLDECSSCGHQVSITAGTVFENTRKPLLLWFRVIRDLLVSKRGCSAKEIQRRHGLSYQTAWTWLHKLRSCMDRNEIRPLKGTVQVDEAYICTNAGARHKDLRVAGNKCLVVAAVEDKGPRMGRLRLAHLSETKEKSLQDFVQANIERGSTLKGDGLAAFSRLGMENSLPSEAAVGPKRVPKRQAKPLRVFSLLQRVLLGTYQGAVCSQHLDKYLDEYVFRFNRRTSASRYLLVDRLLGEVFKPPPTYAELARRGLQKGQLKNVLAT